MRLIPAVLLATALALQAQSKVQGFTLPNGLRVLHVEEHEHLLLRVQLYLSIEPGAVPADRPGLPLLLQRMYDRAETANLRAEEFERILGDSGIQLTSSTEPEALVWRLVARSRDQDRALGLLADRLLRTLLDPALLETQKLACRRELEQPEGSPHERLRHALIQAPATTPTPASLNALTLGDLLDFRAKTFRPDRAILILHGDLGLEQAKRLALLNLGTWAPQPVPTGGHVPAGSAPAQLTMAPRIPAPGTGLRIQIAAPRPPDLTPEAMALLKLLVPGDVRLLPARVAIENGWLVATLDGEASVTGSSVVSLLRGRLEILRQRGFVLADLERARSAWSARRSLDSLHPEAQMDRALAEAQNHSATEARVKVMSLEALNTSLRNWLDPTAFRTGASGDPEALKSLPTP